MLLALDLADAYNGQQGDMWDPQKGMAVAMLGGALSCMLAALIGRRRPS